MIYGFHKDGSECHSMHCALPHRLNDGMDTRPSGEVRAEFQQRIDELGKQLPGGLFTAKKPEDIRFPPAVGTSEWFAGLTPQQRERLTESATVAAARMVNAIAPVAQLLQDAFAPAVQELSRVLKPFADQIAEIERERQNPDVEQ